MLKLTVINIKEGKMRYAIYEGRTKQEAIDKMFMAARLENRVNETMLIRTYPEERKKFWGLKKETVWIATACIDDEKMLEKEKRTTYTKKAVVQPSLFDNVQSEDVTYTAPQKREVRRPAPSSGDVDMSLLVEKNKKLEQEVEFLKSSIFEMNELLKFVNDVIIGVMGVYHSTIALCHGSNNKLKVQVSSIFDKKELAEGYVKLLNEKKFPAVIKEVPNEEKVFIQVMGNFNDRKKALKTAAKSKDIIHIDFFAVHMDEKIVAPVHVKIVGKAEGVKMGGVLRHILREITVKSLPTDIPPHIEVDVTKLGIGDSIHVRDLALPPTVQVLTDPEAAIVNVLAPTVQKEEKPAEAAEAAPAAEPQQKEPGSAKPAKDAKA